MRIGIEAWNIKSGGGVRHLRALLNANLPGRTGVECVTVSAPPETLAQLPKNSSIGMIESSPRTVLASVLQESTAARALRFGEDVLFVPGGIYTGTFRPFVAMSQNLLPFEPGERARYGLTLKRVRLLSLRYLQQATFRKASGVIYLSDYARMLVEGGSRDVRGKSETIPHGLWAGQRARPRVQLPIGEYSSQKPFQVLYVSTVDLYKHQCDVAVAISQLRERGYPIVTKFVGGSYATALKQFQGLVRSLDPDQKFLFYDGRCPLDQVAEYYKTADLFVFASSCENMPNILLEAMGSGLPIACSNRQPMPEVLGDAGIYFDPEDPKDIAAAVEVLLIDEELRARCAASAYERSLQFNWEETARRTFEFLIAAANGQRSPKAA